ncbi:MAG TPA: RNA methyltransferase [Pyrinomonadaceae bacterium]
MDGIRRITSRDNDQLRYARRVRDGKVGDEIFIEGVRLVEEALRSRIKIGRLFVADDSRERVAGLLRTASGGEVFELSNSAFQSICDTVTSQGIVALAERPATSMGDIRNRLRTAKIPLVIFLHQINNPSNLGAVIRTAEAAGVAGLVVSAESADVFSPKALRASMGSTFRLPIVTGIDLDEVLDWARTHHLRTIGADTHATKAYAEIDWRVPRLLVVGSEAHGLSETDRAQLDELTLIPMEREVESLNLAVACGIVLFEARRQQGTS